MQGGSHIFWMIGFGNDQRKDDGMGPLIVKRVEDIFKHNENVRFLTLPQLDVGLVEQLRGAGLIVFVDATIENLENGWMCKRLYPQVRQPPYLSHHIQPSFLLGLLQAIDPYTIPCWQVSIQGYDFGLGTQMSSMAKKRAESAIWHIVRWVEKWIDREKNYGKNIFTGACHE